MTDAELKAVIIADGELAISLLATVKGNLEQLTPADKADIEAKFMTLIEKIGVVK